MSKFKACPKISLSEISYGHIYLLDFFDLSGKVYLKYVKETQEESHG